MYLSARVNPFTHAVVISAGLLFVLQLYRTVSVLKFLDLLPKNAALRAVTTDRKSYRFLAISFHNRLLSD